LSEATEIVLIKKNIPLVINIAVNILKESWALVYLIIPEKVFNAIKTKVLIIPNIKIFRLSSMWFTVGKSKLDLIK